MMQYFKEYQATVMNVSWQYQEILGDIGNISWHPDLLCRGYFFILAMNTQQANRQLDIFFTAHLSRQGSLSTSLWWFVYIYILCTYVYIIYPWFGDVPADWLNPHKTPSPSCGKNRVVFVCWSWILGIRLTELFRTMFDFFIVIEWTKQQNMVLKVIQYNLCSS